MNILFLYNNVIDKHKGGVQRITSVLSDHFSMMGNKTFYLSTKREDNAIIDSEKQFLLPDTTSVYSIINISFLKSFIVNSSINVIINQAGSSSEWSKLAFSAKPLGVKIISCIHLSLLTSVLNFSLMHSNVYPKFILSLIDTCIVKNVLLNIFRLKWSSHYKELYKYSDSVILLSESFYADFMYITKLKTLEKLHVIPNAISISDQVCIDNEKQNELLFVGRLDYSKRVDLLLVIWSKIQHKYPNWCLRIVGDGTETNNLKELADQLKLINCYFEGFQDSYSYFYKAKIFCFTSVYESFGLVLLEAMKFGAVPIAFNSFSSINDIINNDMDGILVPPCDVEYFVDQLSLLMSNNSELNRRKRNCSVAVKKFSIQTVIDKWNVILNN